MRSDNVLPASSIQVGLMIRSSGLALSALEGGRLPASAISTTYKVAFTSFGRSLPVVVKPQ